MARAIATFDLVGHVNIGCFGLAIGYNGVIVTFLEVIIVRVIDPIGNVGRGSEIDDVGWEIGGGGSEESGF